jgi:hypothetical protein
LPRHHSPTSNRFSVTKPGIIVILFLFACCGTICGLGGYFLGHKPLPTRKPVECQTIEKQPEAVRTRDCPPCKKGRPIIIPKMNCPHTRCTDELDTCRNTLEGIKKWCDAHCPEELEACEHELQEYKYTPYPLRHPYFP